MTDNKAEKKPKSGYWYRFHITECVLCGYTDEWKERVYDKPKPDDGEDRYVYRQTACGHHFC